LINDSSLYCTLAVVVALLPIIFNLVPVDTISEHGYYDKPRWIDHYGIYVINTEGFSPDVLYFRQIDLFGDLSRNTTSSPSSPTSSNDLFENEDPEVQGSIGSESKIEGLQEGSASDVNQTSSPSSPTSLNELSDPEENAEFESDFETNLDLNPENGVSTEDSDGSSDSTSNSSLTNP
jgi:hypothetical protein